MMSYIKQPHYAVNGLTLAGPGMDLLHSAVGYPVHAHTCVHTQDVLLHAHVCAQSAHTAECTRTCVHTRDAHPLHAHTRVHSQPPPRASVSLPPQVWFKNRRAKCRQQQQQSSGQPKARPAKKKPSPPREPQSDAGGAGPYSPTQPGPAGTPGSAAPVSIWSPASISPVPDPLAAGSAPGLPRSAPFSAAPYNQTAPYGQSYGGSAAYFGGLDCGPYLSPMHPPLGAPGAALSPLGAPMGAHLTPSPAALSGQSFGAGLGFGAVDCLEYKEQAGAWKLNFNPADCLDYKEQSSWKFQVL
ncbi:cone-rod homeobox protein [Phasianus colchicus]|uniref:cone-rod homeobox protein n=1 Tax=Phasianus colchicus TaxID=9054 RepID=UPI00129ED2B1|nr:cone-rod homeobox protein [Phasianus colchicus]